MQAERRQTGQGSAETRATQTNLAEGAEAAAEHDDQLRCIRARADCQLAVAGGLRGAFGVASAAAWLEEQVGFVHALNATMKQEGRFQQNAQQKSLTLSTRMPLAKGWPGIGALCWEPLSCRFAEALPAVVGWYHTARAGCSTKNKVIAGGKCTAGLLRLAMLSWPSVWSVGSRAPKYTAPPNCEIYNIY